MRKARRICIVLFVVVWIAVFHYESLRFFYLQPFFNDSLPKVKFLFPPAGWIMFYNVDDQFGYAQVYGVKNDDAKAQAIDPHDILATRSIGYDNIHRNVLSEALGPQYHASFCAFLKRKFPYFDKFLITEVYYPSLTRSPAQKIEKVAYSCGE